MESTIALTTKEFEIFPKAALERIIKNAKYEEQPISPPLNIKGTLAPYEGEWNFQTSKHLLMRTMYGPTRMQIEAVENLGLEEALDVLLTERPPIAPPINYNFPGDPFVGIGESWVDAPTDANTSVYRRRSFRAWLTGAMFTEDVSVHEKMVLFWHNHFVVSNIRDSKFEYQYWNLLRQNALGNFRSFTKAITLNPAMLRYLNGVENTRNAPNENYARELFELFTIGKGPAEGLGDYTTFTEEDVAAAAKILTGWKINYSFETGDLPQPTFFPNLHDNTTKKLSHRFGQQEINNEGEGEYAALIDVIFQDERPALFLARKLYRWFVYYHIDETIEINIIEPLAQILVDHNFDIKPALRALFASEHFYDVNSIGCQLKSPVDFINNNVKQFGVKLGDNITDNYVLWFGIFQAYDALEQGIMAIPLVAGWKAYFQEPTYNRLWINSVSLPLRRLYTDIISTIGYSINNRPFVIDVFEVVDNLPDPFDPNEMIRELSSHVLPLPITDGQIEFLKEVLIPGLPDDEWTIEYNAYVENPDNEVIRLAVEIKLRQMFQSLMSMAEYHLQ